VRASSISGMGLFATVPLRRGDLIGFYSGTEISTTQYHRLTPDQRSYVMEIVPGVFFAPNPKTDVLSRVNEPVEGKRANVSCQQFALGAEGRKSTALAVAISFVVAEPVAANTELTAHYGGTYDSERARRRYRVGTPARTVAAHEMQPVHDVFRFLPLECFVSTERAGGALLGGTATPQHRRPVGRPPVDRATGSSMTWDASHGRYVSSTPHTERSRGKDGSRKRRHVRYVLE
jgi:hypothetical protein